MKNNRTECDQNRNESEKEIVNDRENLEEPLKYV